jgi:putative transposase
MARKPRFNMVGMPQHIVQRGNNRNACFFDQTDYRFYLDSLSQASEKYGCTIHAYVLMTNHVHLLVTQQVEYGVSQLMQSVGRKYVRHVNDTYRRTGTLWEGRYKASLVDAESYLLTCYRYIELNPVRAGMVQSPGDYGWSSYRCNALGKSNSLVTPHELYIALGDKDKDRQAEYRKLLSSHVDEKTLQRMRESLNQELVIGTDKFKDDVERHLARRVKRGKAGRPRLKRIAY